MTLDDGLGSLTSYRRHFPQFGESHDLLLLNGLPCYIDLRGYTCFSHSEGVGVVDYVLVDQGFLPHI